LCPKFRAIDDELWEKTHCDQVIKDWKYAPQDTPDGPHVLSEREERLLARAHRPRWYDDAFPSNQWGQNSALSSNVDGRGETASTKAPPVRLVENVNRDLENRLPTHSTRS